MDFMHVSEELDEAEKTLKRFYLRNPERYDRSPCQEEEVRSLLALVFPLGPMETDSEEEQLNTLIKEQTFIPPTWIFPLSVICDTCPLSGTGTPSSNCSVS